MNGSNRVPFGLLIDESGKEELVAVDEVPNGLACKCICPSCKIELVARHGVEKTWHFGHKPRKTEAELKVTCDFSYHVSIVAMAKKLFTNGVEIDLPEYKLTVHRDYEPIKVVKKARVVIDSFQVEPVYNNLFIDVLAFVNSTPFLIYFEHAEKLVTITASTIPDSLSNARVIKINVSNFFLLSNKPRQELFELLFNSTNGKQWIYHPRQIEKIKEAKIQIEEQKKNDALSLVPYKPVLYSQKFRQPPKAKAPIESFAEKKARILREIQENDNL